MSISLSNNMTSVSDAWTQALATSMVNMAKTKLEEVLLRFTEVVADTDFEVDGATIRIPRSKLCEIWSTVAPDCAMDLNIAIEKESKKKEAEIKKLQKKEEEKKGPCCEYVYGAKAKKADQECRDFCKDPTEAEDGKTYCNKHKKQVGSKHTCCFVFGAKALKKAGQECGSRIAKEAVPFDRQGEYDDLDYEGKWLCKKHTEQVEKSLDRKDNLCSHVYGDKSKNPGEQCTSIAKESGKCAKHQGGGKKEKVKTAEKDKRAALKKGGDEDEKSSSDDESRIQSIVEKKPSEADTVTVKINFKKKKSVNFVCVSCTNEDQSVFSGFVDSNSGLVCINPTHPDSKEIKPELFQSIGIWDNDIQTFTEMTEESTAYSKLIGIDVYSPDPDDETDEE